MNIFYLDKHAGKAAEMMHDKHVVKMILETAQLLSTAHRVLDGEMYIGKTANTGRNVKRWKMDDEYMENTLYKATHINHPSAVWARESNNNYTWLYYHFMALCQEYTHRYGKTHACEDKLIIALAIPPKNIPNYQMTAMPQAMPDEYKDSKCSVQAYRNYYKGAKKHQSKYTNREAPEWL